MAVCIPRPDRWTNTRKPPAEGPDEPLVHWRDCPTCWAQTRLWSMASRRYEVCWTCCGVGQIGEVVG